MTTDELIAALNLNFDQSEMLRSQLSPSALKLYDSVTNPRPINTAKLLPALLVGPLSKGRPVNSQELHQFSRAWRKLICDLNKDQFSIDRISAEVALHSLGVRRFKKSSTTMYVKI